MAQLLNAKLLIFFILVGIWIIEILHCEKTYDRKSSILLDNISVFKCVQPENTLSPRYVTHSGIYIVIKFEQLIVKIAVV